MSQIVDAIKKNYKSFGAIIGLLVISIVVAGYILTQQRLRIPFISQKTTKMYIQMDSAQAVTPGQGQTIQIAGVEIGSIAKVELKNGKARVAVDVDDKYKHLIHRDATALLRPRTGLKDMFIQIAPGSEGKPVGKGFTIPARNTLSDVDLDQILAALDVDTRDYIRLLVGGAKTGLEGRGSDTAELFRRYQPTARDLARVSRSVAKERTALKRTVNSFARLNRRLSNRRGDLTQLISASATTFGAFAAEQSSLRSTVRELAPTLRQTTTTLRDIVPFAKELRPTSDALVPTFRALDRANRAIRPFAREATPIVRTQIRPFTRAARPLVRDLKPASQQLSATIPNLATSLGVVNRFFNLLGYNPGGTEPPSKPNRDEGNLFWLAWTAHQGANLQNIADANGPLRPVFLTGTCGTLSTIANFSPAAEFGLNLSPLLATVCGNPKTLSIDLDQVIKDLTANLPGGIGDLVNQVLPDLPSIEGGSAADALTGVAGALTSRSKDGKDAGATGAGTDKTEAFGGLRNLAPELAKQRAKAAADKKDGGK